MIAITGATGFLGNHLIDALKSKGMEFTCLVREDSPRRESLEKKGAHLNFVDFHDSVTLEPILFSSDILIHALGLINGSAEELQTVNVDYTRSVVEAAKRARVRKIVLVSSVAALMPHGLYGQTKAAGEKIVRESGIPYTALRPAYIYGSGDRNSTELMLRTLRRTPVVPLLGGGDFKLQPVYVDDVVDLIVQAVMKPACNTEFSVAGPAQISLKEMLLHFSKGLGVKRAYLPIPLKPVQAVLRVFLKLFPNTKFPAKQILELDKHGAFDISKTREAFRFDPIPFSQGVEKMFKDISCAE